MYILLAAGVLAVGALACSLGGAAGATQAPAATAIVATVQVGQAGTAAPTTAPGAATAAPTEAANAAPTEAGAPSGDPLDVIGRALRAQLSAPAYRRHTTGVDGDTTYDILIEYVAPDYLHQVVGKNEFVYIKDVGTWRKGSDGAWIAAPTDSGAPVFAALDPATVDDLLKSVDISQVKFLGPQVLDGRPMWQYQFVTRTDIGNGKIITSTSKLWVGVADGLPYRTESESDSVLHEGAKTQSVSVSEYPTDIVRIQPNP
jgi:hypothetical protein